MSEPLEGPASLSVHEAWSAVMHDVRSLAKDGTKTGGGSTYKFRGIDAVMNAAGPAFRKHGVVVYPKKVRSIEYTEVIVGANKSVMQSVRVIITYRAIGPLGDHMDMTAPGEAFDSGDKATAKAMSVAYRTLLLQALTLPTDDRDPDADGYERTGSDAVAKAMAADLGKLRGEVAAAGVSLPKLRALWDRMVEEYPTCEWSVDREAILTPAIEHAKAAAARAAQDQAAESPAREALEDMADGVVERLGDAADEEAVQAEHIWRLDLSAAVAENDLRAVRQLIDRAHRMGRPDLRKDAQATLNEMKAQQ